MKESSLIYPAFSATLGANRNRAGLETGTVKTSNLKNIHPFFRSEKSSKTTERTDVLKDFDLCRKQRINDNAILRK